MHRHSLKLYIVLALGLVMLFALPKPMQNLFRNQFLKPIIPFASLVPFRGKYANKPKKAFVAKNEFIEKSAFNGHLAKIIFRNPNTWNDFFWINMGKKDNHQEPKIALHSPILYEGKLIGLVDYVGKKQSRVQLITNASLAISVRAYRGEGQYKDCLEAIESLKQLPQVEQDTQLQSKLTLLEKDLSLDTAHHYLAKGELYGSSHPLWRSKGQCLEGRGFQCQFSDEKNPKRDLLTGKAQNDPLDRTLPILNKGDLLITTGFDGVLPRGLEVARVTEISPLSEGECTYSLKAKPLAGKLKDLNYVEVILPVDFEPTNVGLPAFEE